MMIKAIFTLAALLTVAALAGCGGGEESGGSPAPSAARDSQGLSADHSHEPTPEPLLGYTWSEGPDGGGADLIELEALRACTGKRFSYWDDQPWPPALDAEEAECVEQHLVEAAAHAEATRTALDQIEAYCEELNLNAIDEETPETWGKAARAVEDGIEAFEDITPPGDLEGYHTVTLEHFRNLHALLKSEDRDAPFDPNSDEFLQPYESLHGEYTEAVFGLPGGNPVPRLEANGCDF